MDSIENKEEITLEYFIQRLFELYTDCNREEYYAEVFVPFFRMCCPDSSKIIPMYDDRKSGKKTDIETNATKRMKTICAVKKNGKYVVPDFIYVPNEYSYANPCKPYVMIETKSPVFLKDGKYYRPLDCWIDKETIPEITAEINACGTLIFTDGITWKFLSLNKNKKIIENPEYKQIELIKVNYDDKYYKTRRVSARENNVKGNLQLIDTLLESENWDLQKTAWIDLKEKIRQLVTSRKKCYSSDAQIATYE